MKRILCLAALGLGLLALPRAASPAVVAVRHGGYAHTTVAVRGGPCCCCYHPVARTAAVVGAVAVGTAIGNAASAPPPLSTVTTVSVGTVVPALPGGCTTVQVNGVTYHQCSGVYYRPYYQGDTLVYQVSRP